MLQPPGFSQHTITTSLGNLVYYTAAQEPWVRSPETTPQPTLVFLHGFGGGSSAYEWSKVYPAFALEYRILAPDLLGWGRSEHLRRDYQIEDYLVTIREFLDQTCGNEAVTVVASSLTAAFVVLLAIADPKRFKSLILSAPSGISDFGKNYKGSFFARMASIPVVDRLLYGLAIATRSGIRGFLQRRQFAHANRLSQEVIDAYLASAQLPYAEYTALSFVRGDLCFDLADQIAKLQVPTAIVWGKLAQLTNYKIGQRFAEMNPKAIRSLRILEDVGLTPHLELPGVAIAVIREFLKDLSH
ncbi:MAG: alpha/beta hydrolase [Oculatellaceae cyanobacterium Prado106]|jgi:pimeloyl-ACP methyl ester carboxylesterase|nr:alpha/beta hydrolase [Oculatellaceae cyanobacterium Prado106]